MPDNSESLFRQFIKDIRANAELKIEIASSMLARCESPIEHLFLCSYFARAMSPQFLKFLKPLPDIAQNISLWHQAFIGEDFHKIELYVQRTLRLPELGAVYRVDFLICIPSKNAKIIIELDGHDFHEKTKEQAQRDKERDRNLTHAGYKIFRFTGSEVYRNCDKVLDSIYELYDSLREVAA